MNDSNNNNNTGLKIPYGGIAFVLFIFGFICAYLAMDLFAQKKADMSIIKVIYTMNDNKDKVDKLESILKNSKVDSNSTVKTYKLFINGSEHNFSFSDFYIRDLKLDSQSIDYIINKGNL